MSQEMRIKIEVYRYTASSRLDGIDNSFKPRAGILFMDKNIIGTEIINKAHHRHTSILFRNKYGRREIAIPISGTA